MLGFSIGLSLGGRRVVALDTTLRIAYPQRIGAPNNAGYTTILRWPEIGRYRMDVRARVGNSASFKIGRKGTQTQGQYVDSGGITTVDATLTAGQVYSDLNNRVDLSQLTVASDPGDVWSDIEVELLDPLGSAPSFPATIKRHTISSPVWTAQSATMMADGVTWLRASSNLLQFTTNWAETINTGGTPVWTTAYTLPASFINRWIKQLPNGEILTCVYQAGGNTRVFKSTGWAVNKLTATWSEVLTIGNPASFDGNYNAHQFNAGTNGVVVLAENGSQTLGGVGNDAIDNLRTVRLWLSEDFGQTWRVAFNIRDFGAAQGFAYPAGVHLHGCAYDEAWDRIYVAYGDDTGDGQKIAGPNFTQVVYSDDRGATWQKLKAPDNWLTDLSGARGACQWINIMPTEHGLILSPDVSQPVFNIMYRKAGYRLLGSTHLLTPVNGLSGRFSKGGGRYFSCGISASGSVAAGSNAMSFAVGEGDLSWDIVRLTYTTTAAGYVGGTSIQGPTATGLYIIGVAGTTAVGANPTAICTMDYS